MTSKERMIRTLTFNKPDKIPVQSWALPCVYEKYGQDLYDVISKYSVDIAFPAYTNPVVGNERFEVGVYVDGWGCEWHNVKQGIVGEVKKFPLENWDNLSDYKPPIELLSKNRENIEKSILENKDKFILSHWCIDIFERMQHIRGVENLLMDIAEESDEFFKLRDMVFEYYSAWVDMWLSYDVDGIVFADDWGTQISMLISPDSFRRLYKPLYAQLIKKIKAKNKYVFFHSDGYIMPIIGDLIEIGVDALNSQLWCMDIEEISRLYKGKVTFWGELDRQGVLAFGSTQDIKRDIDKMKELFIVNGGGLIGTASPGDECSFENIVVTVSYWND